MSTFFLDTSAIAKRYIPETGSTWINSLVLPQTRNTVVISRLTMVEFVSALVRRQREKSISLNDLEMFRGAFLDHVNQIYTVINLTKDVLADARTLLERYPLRTLDAIQLASPLKGQITLETVLTFISADTRLLSAAAAEGLPTDNPNAQT
ncbi:MAG: type II toxin-antitoxin system VapC family toxin [Chloroflexi bacterium]|nr:type II toxin-antitoxin system VapC family toxin [Chloroflexota bacterium]